MYIYIMHMNGGYSQGGRGRMPPPAPPKETLLYPYAQSCHVAIFVHFAYDLILRFRKLFQGSRQFCSMVSLLHVPRVDLTENAEMG